MESAPNNVQKMSRKGKEKAVAGITYVDGKRRSVRLVKDAAPATTDAQATPAKKTRRPQAKLVKNDIEDEDKPLLANIITQFEKRKGYTRLLMRLFKKYAKRPDVLVKITQALVDAESQFKRRKLKASDTLKQIQQNHEEQQNIRKVMKEPWYTLTEYEPVKTAFDTFLEEGFTIQFNTNKLRTVIRPLLAKNDNAKALEQLNEVVAKALQEVFDRIKVDFQLKGTDLIKFNTHRYVMNHPFIEVKKWTVKWLMGMIAKQLQSWMNNDLENDFTMSALARKTVQGAGYAQQKFVQKKDLINKSSLIMIENPEDKMCAPRAVAVGIIRHELDANTCKETKNRYDNVCRKPGAKYPHGSNLQRELAQAYCDAVNKPNDEPWIIEDIQKLENHLCVRIMVVDYKLQTLNKSPFVYLGDSRYEQRIYLLYVDNHFHYIRSIAGYLGCCYFCEACNTGFADKNKHACTKVECKCCMSKTTDHFARKGKYDKMIECKDCNRLFASEECIDYHYTANTCEKMFKCLECDKLIRVFELPDKLRENHRCGFVKCTNCHEYAELNHPCFMQQQNVPDAYTEKYVFFDFEAIAHPIGGSKFKHEVNLAISRYFDESIAPITHTSLDDFCEWVFDKKHKGYTFIAHNLKGYDGHFILNYCYKNNLKPFVIFSGSKIMYLNIQSLDIKFIDSLNFIACGLSKIPKMFGFQNELKKGWFPHLFNTPENQSYRGTYPPIHFYEPDKMMLKDREDFLKWYATKQNDVFDFQEQFHYYCLTDVDVLLRGCKILRKLFIDTTKIDCFQSITIASACMKIYRTNFLQPKTIGITKNDDIIRDKFSVKSIIALEYLMHKENIKIRHALNGGEVVIGGYKVDGLCKETRTIYQYDGCYFHGCTKCYDGNHRNKVNGKTMNELASATNEIRKALFSKGYEIITINECEDDLSKLNNPDYAKWLESFDSLDNYIGVLHPRKGFFGGRTDVRRLYAQTNADEKILYYDFTSLYPTVNKYGWYPIGHPTILRDVRTTDVSPYHGLIYCDILPPVNLDFPVLPAKINGKLMFPLCTACATNSSNQCKHSVQERMMRGVWTHLEVAKAVEKGYTVFKIHEVHHFEQGMTGLFSDYVNMFLKIKAEASGYPEDCETDEKKQAYVLKYKTRECIDLDPSKIERNEGLRALAKLCLNSLWGKFGQRPNQIQHEHVVSMPDYLRLEQNKSIEIVDVHIVCDDSEGDPMIDVLYKYKAYDVPDPTNTNIYIAIFTTSQARLMLYEKLDLLGGDRVLYYDTDSIIFKTDTTCPTIEEGDFLGLMKNELGSDYITHFVSTGAKSYSYTTAGGDSVCKIKGFTLNYQNSQTLNFKALQQTVESRGKQTHSTTNDFKITRTARHEIISQKEVKIFGMEIDKGVVDWTTGVVHPFGFFQPAS